MGQKYEKTAKVANNKQANNGFMEKRVKKLKLCPQFYHKPTTLMTGFRYDFVKIILIENDNFDLTLRKRRFCDAKEPLLPCKTYAFGTQNNRFYNALIIRWLCDRYACEKYLHLYCLFSVYKTRSFGEVV